mgnify:CR=1 FL=1
MIARIIGEVKAFASWIYFVLPEVLVTVLVVLAFILGVQFIFN